MWGQALHVQQEVPPPTEWRWKEYEKGLVPNWTDLNESGACQ